MLISLIIITRQQQIMKMVESELQEEAKEGECLNKIKRIKAQTEEEECLRKIMRMKAQIQEEAEGMAGERGCLKNTMRMKAEVMGTLQDLLKGQGW